MIVNGAGSHAILDAETQIAKAIDGDEDAAIKRAVLGVVRLYNVKIADEIIEDAHKALVILAHERPLALEANYFALEVTFSVRVKVDGDRDRLVTTEAGEIQGLIGGERQRLIVAFMQKVTR